MMQSRDEMSLSGRIAYLACMTGLACVAGYLEMLLPLHRISFTKVYVNSLVNSHDFRAMEFIDGLLLLLDRTNNGEEGVEMGEEEKDFLDFLKRRKVSVLVNQNHFSEAREILWSMLEEPANNDFAVKMLAKMQRSKNED